jgi:hypothetical protein
MTLDTGKQRCVCVSRSSDQEFRAPASCTLLYVDLLNPVGSINADLELSNTELRIGFAAFSYSCAAFQLVGGWIAHRFGARAGLWPFAGCSGQ